MVVCRIPWHASQERPCNLVLGTKIRSRRIAAAQASMTGQQLAHACMPLACKGQEANDYDECSHAKPNLLMPAHGTITTMIPLSDQPG